MCSTLNKVLHCFKVCLQSSVALPVDPLFLSFICYFSMMAYNQMLFLAYIVTVMVDFVSGRGGCHRDRRLVRARAS